MKSADELDARRSRRITYVKGLTYIVPFILVICSLFLAAFSSYLLPAIICRLTGLLIFWFCMVSMMSGRDIVDIRLTRPKSLYGLFFALYSATELITYPSSTTYNSANAIQISIIVMLCYLGWNIGMNFAGKPSTASYRRDSLDAARSKAFFLLCAFCVSCVAANMAWRISQGMFFTHAKSFAQEATGSASFISAFCGTLGLPTLLLCGYAACVSDRSERAPAKALFWSYLSVRIALLTLASQFSELLVSVIFTAVIFQTFGKLRIRFSYVLYAGAFLSMAFVVIMTVRVVAMYSYEDTGNPVMDAVHVLGGGIKAMGSSEGFQMIPYATSRSSDQLTFLSILVDKFNGGREHVHFSLIGDSMSGMIPRVVWPSKPVQKDMALTIESALDLPENDWEVGPVVTFYVEYGLAGSFILSMCFGLFIGKLTKFAASRDFQFMWVWLFLIWDVAARPETELQFGILSATRTLMVIYCMYKVFYFMFCDRALIPKMLEDAK